MADKLHLPKGDGVEYDDYTVSFNSKTGKLTVNCPKSEKINVIVKGLGGVRKVNNVKSWNCNSHNGDLALVAEGSDIDVDIIKD